MQNTEFIKQLTSPSFKVKADGPTSPQWFDQYFSDLESMRMVFVEYLTSCNEVTIKAYLQELEDAIRIIEGRHFVGFPESDLVSLTLSGLEQVAVDFREWKILDEGLLKSAKKTVAFINTVLGVTAEPSKVEEQPQLAKQAAEPAVICSVEGLKNKLGCGKTKAFEIVKSGILVNAGIQYRVGKKWMFNAKKLSDYLSEHPDFLR